MRFIFFPLSCHEILLLGWFRIGRASTSRADAGRTSRGQFLRLLPLSCVHTAAQQTQSFYKYVTKEESSAVKHEYK